MVNIYLKKYIQAYYVPKSLKLNAHTLNQKDLF